METKERETLQPPAKLALIHPSKNNPRLLQLSPRTRFKSPIYIFCGGGILACSILETGKMPVPQMPFPPLKNGDFPAVSAKSYPGTSGSPEMLYILELMASSNPCRMLLK